MNMELPVKTILGDSVDAITRLASVASETRDADLTLNLTANENRPSNTALSLIGSPVSARYLLGRPRERQGSDPLQVKAGLMLKAFPELSSLESVAADRACAMFNADMVDFRPLSGLHATLCSLLSFTRPGEVVYSIDPLNGGHFATAALLRLLGRESAYLPWNQARCTIDLPGFARAIKAARKKPTILLDHGTPLFPLPVGELRELVRHAPIIYDGSHSLGLIAGGKFQSPLSDGADILQGNTHKTFPGPQKALIAFRRQADADQFDSTVSAALISSAHTHHIAALCLTVLEMSRYGAEYARQIVENARYLAEWLSHLGLNVFRVDGEATQSHLLLLTGFAAGEAYELCRRLNTIGISVNARNGASGEYIRIGVQEITRRGVTRADVKFIAEFIALAQHESTNLDDLRTDVDDFMSQFRSVRYSFDKHDSYPHDHRKGCLTCSKTQGCSRR